MRVSMINADGTTGAARITEPVDQHLMVGTARLNGRKIFIVAVRDIVGITATKGAGYWSIYVARFWADDVAPLDARNVGADTPDQPIVGEEPAGIQLAFVYDGRTYQIGQTNLIDNDPIERLDPQKVRMRMLFDHRLGTVDVLVE